MEYKRIKLNGFILAGMNYYGDPLSTKGGWDEENEIGKTWQRFSRYMETHPNRPYKANQPYYYELHIYDENTAKDGNFEVFIGEECTSTHVPIDLSTKFIPEGDYILCTLRGNEIIKDWWTDIARYVKETYNKNLNNKFLIQRYDDRFKGMEQIADSELDVLVLLEA